ncbi:MAG: hypothetical protein J6Z47_01375, partial [Bacteroidales bacterium]|nr:hypothetical protein [Bacteroidales bacterium]
GDVMEIPAEGGTFAVDVQYNTDVVVEVEPAAQSWIQFVAVRALTSGKLEFSFDANPNPDIRSGKVTVKDKNGKVAPTTLTFVQAEKKVITVGDVMTIPAEGGTFAVDIQYNTDFDVVVESGAQSWIHFVATRALQSGKLEFQFAENQNTDPRQGKVTVKDKSGKVSDITLTFVQEEKKVLTVGDVMTIPAEGGTFSVDVQYNTDVVVEVESAAQSWIHFVAVRALTSGKLEFSFDANPNPDVRTGKVTVRDKNGKVAPTTLVFTQAEKKVIAIVDVMEIPAEGGTFAVDVQYNTDFDVVVEAGAQSWIHFVAVRALTSGKLEFSFDENPSIAPREGKVTVKDKNGKVEPVTLTFVQEEKKVIQVGNVMTIPAEGGTFEVDVEYNTDVVVEVESAAQSWIHFVAVRALSSGQLEFSFDANPNPDVRTGKVTVRDKNGKVSPIILTFEQEPFIDVSSVRDALIAFYEATGGENWINNDNWCSDKPFDEWFGISTSETGYVISILLENNNLSGSIPESLFNLKHLEEIILTSNNLSGEFSDRFWSMPALKKLDLSNNKITGQLTSSIRNAKKLTWLGLGSNFLTGTIPEELSDLEDLWYFSIENVPIVNGVFSEASNSFSGVIPDNLDKLRNLEYFLVEYNNLEGSIPACFGRMPKLTTLIVCGNRLSGKIPVEVYECDNWDDWAPDANIIPQQEGYTLSFDYYQSTDYSNDGKVIRLQTHQKGNGISIVITGDCFTDKDIAAGDFERIARETMEDFFSIEPFTTFRNLFDVYAVIAVSKTTYVNYGTAFNSEFGLGAYVYCDEEAVKEYTRKAIDDIDETLTIVIVNKNKYSGTSYLPYPMYDTDYGTGFAYACFGLQAQSETRRLLINHEANGHGFTKLADEYYYSGSGAYPEQDGEVVGGVYFPMGFFANIEFGWNCPANVKWSRFLTDERYKYDGLGVFEGGYTYEKGVWRPSENSIMGHQGPSNDGNRFNAPSRQAAYYRIHKLAYGSAWEFDYEEFVKYDAINRKTSSPASPARIPETGVVVSVPHTPPVIMKKPDAR